MLPPLTNMPIGAPASKRKKRPKPPCPRELIYKDGEVLNVSNWNRVQDNDASFRQKAIEKIPLEQPFPNNREEVRKLISTAYLCTSTSFETVLRELYQLRPDEETKSDSLPTRLEKEAFVRGDREHVIPQYHLTTVTAPETLVHIIADEEFSIYDGLYPSVGQRWYTNGMIWTNTDPRWEWDGRAGLGSNERKWRCRIEIPEGTQVIMDRSPVHRRLCQLPDGMFSVFPDVVLAPGAFEVKGVTRYKMRGGGAKDEEAVVYLDEGAEDKDSEDEAYARRFLGENTDAEFVDVHLLLRQSMVLPALY